MKESPIVAPGMNRTSLDRDRRISSSFSGAVVVKNKSKRVTKLLGGCGGQDTA